MIVHVFSSECDGQTSKNCLLPWTYKRPKKENQIDEPVCWFVTVSVLVRHTLGGSSYLKHVQVVRTKRIFQFIARPWHDFAFDN